MGVAWEWGEIGCGMWGGASCLLMNSSSLMCLKEANHYIICLTVVSCGNLFSIQTNDLNM